MQRESKPIWQAILYSCWRVVRVVGIAYLLVLLLMIVFENELIYPAPRYPQGNWQPNSLAYEDVNFQAADGTQLHGWYVPHSRPRAHVIYFHGNGEHVAYLAPLLREMSERYQISVFAFDYRGYGRSAGSPSESGVLADSRAAVKWLSQRAGVDADQLIMHGRSLGGAAAVDMAARHGTRGLILESTFSSMPDVAAPLYWWAPVRLLMRTQYNSAEKISAYEGKLLQGHGTDDRLVPLAIGRRLHEAAGQADKRFMAIPGMGHNDSPSETFLQAIEEFYRDLSEKDVGQNKQ